MKKEFQEFTIREIFEVCEKQARCGSCPFRNKDYCMVSMPAIESDLKKEVVINED